MYKICLFSEEPRFVEQLQASLVNICRPLFGEVVIDCFTDIAQIRDDVGKLASLCKRIKIAKKDFTKINIKENSKIKTEYNMYILDLMVNSFDCIELAYKLGRSDMNSIIIFTSSRKLEKTKNYVLEKKIYLIDPMDTIILDKIIQYNYSSYLEQKRLLLTKGSESFKFKFEDIYYAEVANRGINIRTNEGKLYFPMKIREFEEKVGAIDFIKCHKSFIVSISKVTKIKRYNALLDNGDDIPISKSCYNHVRDAFMERGYIV